MKLKNTIEKIINYAAYVTEPQKIIIFGSMAIDTANVFSDLDLLIISDNSINRKEACVRIKSYASQFCLKTDVLIYSEQELENAHKSPNSFLEAVYKSGKIVFKKEEK